MTLPEYNATVKEWAQPLYRFALKLTSDHETAQDCVQQGFITLWENVQQVFPEKAKSYLFTIVHRRCMDSHRNAKRHVNLPESPNWTTEATHENYNTKNLLNYGLSLLTNQDRALILLKDYEGYSYDEIQQITGLNSSQVKVYLHRARKQLKQWMEKNYLTH